MPKPLIDVTIPGQELKQLGGINVVIGKNGSGKSSLLKRFDGAVNTFGPGVAARYISPERSGILKYDPNVESNVASSPDWMKNTRRRNQAAQFKQQTMVNYRRLELLVLREIEKNRGAVEDFESVVRQINLLLDNVKIERLGSDFEILPKKGDKKIAAEEISSGESEIIGLAIECLTFARECKSAPLGWLLLDEPDVHLHPDLQHRFAKLLIEVTKDSTVRVILATHSTPLLAALTTHEDARVSFVTSETKNLSFRGISQSLRTILPVFGAHPLSAIFNTQKLLIVEGEDDVRVWQRAYRSTSGRINVYPVETCGADELNATEMEAAEILESVYESGQAYSVRDRDDGPEADLEPIGPVRRFRLRCRSAENLLLADDTLELLKVDWQTVVCRVEEWLQRNPQHVHFPTMTKFKAEGYPRQTFALKEIRNDLLGLMGTSKSWEDAVGLAIGKVVIAPNELPNSLQQYLGSGICKWLLS